MKFELYPNIERAILIDGLYPFTGGFFCFVAIELLAMVDCNYIYSIHLAPIGILFGAKSIEKV